MKTTFALLASLTICGMIHAQTPDSTDVRKLLSVEQELDSLRMEFLRLDVELQNLRATLAEGSDFEQILATLTGEEPESVPEDQRSRRKRIDALLKAVTARPGQIRFNGGATMIAQGSPDAQNRFSSASGSIDLIAHTTVGNNTLLFFDFEAIGGNGPSPFIPTLTSLNADAGSTQDTDGVDRLTVVEAWAEFTALDDAITVTGGKIDLTNYFDNNGVANDETVQFISGVFVNSSALPAPGSSPGIRLRTTVAERFYIQAALASADNSGDHILDQLFKIGSIGFKVLPETEWTANLRLYGYLHPLAENGAGYGVSVDQSAGTSFAVFVRWNANGREIGEWFGIRRAWSAGGRWITRLDGRTFAVGIAYGESTPSGRSRNNERNAEIYFRHHFNRWIHASAHAQWVDGFRAGAGDLLVFGLRTQINF